MSGRAKRQVAFGCVALVVTGCGGTAERPASGGASTPGSGQPEIDGRPPAVVLRGMPHADRAGIAVLGHGERTVVAGGTVTTGAAWSTIKVPLSIAALKRGGASADVADAIEASKNPPADRLWALLGSPAQAGAAVEQELAAGGDVSTVVQTRQVYPPYSPYGQTDWALSDQARFASSLRCRADAASVYADMGRIAPEDRVGFGATRWAGYARFKIGWGPVRPPVKGAYARELATVTLKDGRTYGIALMARDLTLGEAQRDLTDLAEWLGPRLAQIPARGC